MLHYSLKKQKKEHKLNNSLEVEQKIDLVLRLNSFLWQIQFLSITISSMIVTAGLSGAISRYLAWMAEVEQLHDPGGNVLRS